MEDVDTPYFLVALPQLDDDNFSRTVLLMTQHNNEEGASGIIINAPLVAEGESQTQMVAEVKDGSGETVLEYEEVLFDGGPVEHERLFALHTMSALGEDDVKVADGLFLTSNPDSFHKLLDFPEDQGKRRFFVGMSGWAPGQLESELRTGSWMIVPFDQSFLFEPFKEDEDEAKWRNEIWMKVLRYGGGDPFTMMGQGAVDLGYN